jgi:hypothetical protein
MPVGVRLLELCRPCELQQVRLVIDFELTSPGKIAVSNQLTPRCDVQRHSGRVPFGNWPGSPWGWEPAVAVFGRHSS